MTMCKTVGCAIIVVQALSGCACVSQGVVRVGTYNIRLAGEHVRLRDGRNYWDNRKRDLVSLVRRMDLDVFGLQEVTLEQASYLRENLCDYSFVGEHRNSDRITGEASPVCYRKSRFRELDKGTFWLSETPDKPGSKGWNAACPRVCSYLILQEKSTDRRFCFANAHTDHFSKLACEQGLLLVVRKMREIGRGVPIVFVGDHNCRETDPPARAVSKFLNNALYASEAPPSGGWRTWNGWRWREKEVSSVEALRLTPGERNEERQHPDKTGAERGKSELLDHSFYEKCGGPRIDYIYVSPGVRVLDYTTVNDTRPGMDCYPSDHFPVVATLVLPNPAGTDPTGCL